nr:hypothetical protein [Tanacetum cinerariifolium]
RGVTLIMGDEHLDIILEKESDEFIKSSVENLVPNPSEFEDLSNIGREYDVPVCDDFTTLSNLLFDADDNFSSSDDKSFSDEDVPKEIYSNPLFDEEIISFKIDPHHFNTESDLIESLLNQDSSIISSFKIDSFLDEFADENIVRQPTAFKSKRPRFSKPRYDSQVDVHNDLSKPVTTHYLPKEREATSAKPHHMITSSNFRISSKNMKKFSSNDMVHNHYLEEAKKETQERNRNSEPSLIPSARLHSTSNDSRPMPRRNTQTSRNWPASKNSFVTTKIVPIAEHPRNYRTDSCVTKFLKEVNSRAKVSSNKTPKRNKLVEQIGVPNKQERQIPIGHRFLIQKTSVVQKKIITPRSCLRWKPKGKIFKAVGLRWVPTGKIFASSTTKVDSEPLNGSNADITNQYECEQILNLSAGTSFNPKEEGLRVCSELGIHDHRNELSSSKLVPDVVPPADNPDPVPQRQDVSSSTDVHVPLQQELDFLFGPLYDEFFNAGSTPQDNNLQRIFNLHQHHPLLQMLMLRKTTMIKQNKENNYTMMNSPILFVLRHKKKLSLPHTTLDVGKLKAKGDIRVFVGYSKEFAAFRIYNKRTRKIHKSVNVNFDEISEMSSKQFNLELGLSNLNEMGKSLNPSVSQVLETSKKDLEDLFNNFYDEYFDSSKIMKSSTMNVETSNVKIPSNEEEVFLESSESFQKESSSSSLNDDVQQSSEEVRVPSSNTQSISNNMIPSVDEASTSHNVFNERLEDAYFDASTSFHDPFNVHTFYQPYPHEKKWTKDHPLHKIIEYQLADMFTKALPEDRFKYLVRRIGMRCLNLAELEVLAKESA